MGNTAAHLAFSHGHVEITELLISRGGSSTIKNREGKTPLQTGRSDPSGSAPRSNPDDYSQETMTLKMKFQNYCAKGQADLGLDAARTGRVSSPGPSSAMVPKSRSETMDFKEFRRFLEDEGLAGQEMGVDKAGVSSVFQAAGRNYSSGPVAEQDELDWFQFRQALGMIGKKLKIEGVCGVPVEVLTADAGLRRREKKEWDSFPLCRRSKQTLENDMARMQRQLFLMASRAKHVTSCQGFLLGEGITTGKHLVDKKTMSIYSKPLRVHKTKLAVPNFEKSKEEQEKERLAKGFFHAVDTDRSGNLTRYELKTALSDYGLNQEEQRRIFQLLDSDDSGSVSLNEFLRGIKDADVTFMGRSSESGHFRVSVNKELLRFEKQSKLVMTPKAVSPGLLGHIVSSYQEFVKQRRMPSYEESSRLYTAPKKTAVILPEIGLKKSSTGINTRFARLKPFDSKVLAAMTAEYSDALPGSPTREIEDLQSRQADLSSPTSPEPTDGRGSSGVSQRRKSLGTQAGTIPFSAQVKAQPKSSKKHRPGADLQNSVASPDGKLTSEHARVTLLPHRLTLTPAHQIFFESVEPDEVRRSGSEGNSGGAQGREAHKITNAGHSMLSRHNFRCISAGAGFCIASTDIGIVFTWGSGRYGQLGHRNEIDCVLPRPVEDLHGAAANVSAGFSHSIAVTLEGVMYTWGDGREGKLGHGDASSKSIPSVVHAFKDSGMPVATAQGGGSHTVVLSKYGYVYTFGFGQSGRLGHGCDDSCAFPTLVAALEPKFVVGIAAGAAHSVALTEDHEIYSWGSGSFGQLGHGSGSDEILPRQMQLTALPGVTVMAVAAGESFSCVLRSDGSLVSFGRLTHGRMAEGSAKKDAHEFLLEALSRQSGSDWHHFPD